jgi:hypothetical protein
MTLHDTIAPPGSRAAYLDLFKTVLTVGMIFAHVVQLADVAPGLIEHAFSVYINLITFSGFMLAFGPEPTFVSPSAK